ncbi:hypothetical protein [uncultured Sulfitobacter sp.]|uniref:hypothetical protein n=1 Tax=uncultured Sulfitobacter sp. TaxID=191468 RepID=UPI00262E230D|nr:hypothetical protein [uncultured Sulfitobacter sp.]
MKFIEKIAFAMPFPVIVAAVLMHIPKLAGAQTVEEFRTAFSGEWYSFEPAYSTGDAPCMVSLPAPTDAKVSAANCIDPVSETARWRIEEGQIVLLTDDGKQLGSLGGNQFRISGSLPSGDPFILERREGTSLTRAMSAAIAKHKCIFKGYSDDCVVQSDLALPEFSDGVGEVSTLTALNVRAQPRGDASIIGSLPEKVCLKVNACLRASDGFWCRARFGETDGWIAKTAIRSGEWPVMTYVAECAGE